MKQKQLKKRKKYIYDVICTKDYQPMRAREIAILLQVPREKRGDLQDTLDGLVQEGRVAMDRRGRYYKAPAVKPGKASKKKAKEKHADTLCGVFVSHPRGFGFVEIDGEEQDYFIPGEYTGGAFHMDTVEIIPLPQQGGKRREARVAAVREHGITEVVGTFEQDRAFGFVRSDNMKIGRDIFVSQKNAGGARDGQKVVVRLTEYGGHHRSPEGKVTEILGDSRDPGVDVLSVARSMGLPMEFPERVMNQALRVAGEVSEADRNGREDLRDLQMVTIDGEDAKDLDDAVSLTVEGGMYHLGVHIADVSNYVQAGSALDREAFKRGTSVYLVDRVLPMLPVQLSNGICSLNAGEDRLALSCLMDIDSSGRVVDHRIVESVIRVNRRMTYTEVNHILTDPDGDTARAYGALTPMLLAMGELSARIRSRRSGRGSIDFDFPECKIILGATGHPIEIRPYERNAATDLIEDFMLSANETVAREFCEREIPFVYRTHENPDRERLEGVLHFIHTLGIRTKKARQEVSPGEIQEILDGLRGNPCEDLVSRLLLRSMKQAKYTTACTGHFGLAAKYYCHFTSPIRRYPDLQIHRIIKDSIRGRLKPEKIAWYGEHLESVAAQSSTTERRAQEAERETDKMKMAEYMSCHLEEIFSGRISGVTSWGIFVELPNTVEGLVRLSDMVDDYYQFDEEHYQIAGEHSRKAYRLGDPVRVRVKGADPAARTIDFTLVDGEREKDGQT